MNENPKAKKILFPILILALIAVIFGLIVFAKTKSSNNISSDGKIILFYGQGCSYCKALDKWIDENKIAEKVSFEKKEVYNNATNARILTSKAKACGLDENSIGVPFLWDGSKCHSGADNIQKFFSEKINLK